MGEVKTLVSAEEFFQMPEPPGRKLELVRGEVVEMSPPGLRHGRLTLHVGGVFTPVAEAHDMEIFAEFGCRLSRDPDSVRAPDLALVSRGRLADPEQEGFFEGAPDVIIEILSPHDRATDVAEKVDDWLKGGARLVLVLAPKARTVTKYRPDGTAQLLREADILTGDDVLPGLDLLVRRIFER